MLGIRIRTHDRVHTRKLPWPLRYQRDYSIRIVALYVSCFTWWIVTYVRRRTSRAPRSVMNSQASGSTWAQIALKPRQPGRPGGLCRPWPGEGPGRSWAVLSSLCCRNAAARQVPGLGPAETTIKLFVWAGISIKTIGKKKSKGWIVQDEVQGLPPIPGKVYHFILSSDSGCHIMIDFLLFGYYYQS